ncbi:hypothetical protein EIP91_009529 [Steccherinum ochraceum]|uniref:Phosphogluconate dehydrogenase NAD-binding putative C-terminal domain-containing protein n=1 Tax=Steccherinum ochraceum TaxID=92696 RepID=A0A4R0R1J0_9APHY|nr:hypothetical protein EIP91_009529 [Steccherinum ochraceum]
MSFMIITLALALAAPVFAAPIPRMLILRATDQGQSSSSSTGPSGATMSGSNYSMYSGPGGASLTYQGATENKGPSATQEIGQQSISTSGAGGAHSSSQQQVVNSKREEEDILARHIYDIISRRSPMESQQSSQSSSGRGGTMSSSQSSSSGGRGNMMESQQSSMSSNGSPGSMMSSQSSSISRREALAALLIARQNLQMNQQSATAQNPDGSTDRGVQQQISLDHIHMQQQSGTETMGRKKRSDIPSGFISALAARALAREPIRYRSQASSHHLNVHLTLFPLFYNSDEMVLPVIAIIAPGAMGAAVAKRLTTAGLTVLTHLEGRSPATRKRALDAGMQDSSLPDIAARARWILSILPPSDAFGFAQKFKSAHSELKEQASAKIVFADCNAISPETVKRIAGLFAGTPIGFIDAGIIGGPPHEGYDPVFYTSVDRQDDHLLTEFESLKAYGLNVSAMRGEGAGIGDASALKMSYAGITKGTIGLFTTMILAAQSSSPATATALLHELASSQPFFLKRITTSVPGMLPKAYRWVGEMEEISSFVGGGEGKIHEGMARLYERIEGSVEAGEGDGGDDVRVLKAFVEEAKRVIEEKEKRGIS